MRHIGFKNFRRFTDFPNMKFGDITILVGSNNSGKSTILKALMLVFDNIRNMRIVDRNSLDGENIFRFDGNHIHEVHVDTFGRALNNQSKSNDITFDLGMEGFSIRVLVTGNDFNRPDTIIKDVSMEDLKHGITYDINYAASEIEVAFENAPGKINKSKEIKEKELVELDMLRSQLIKASSAKEAADINEKIEQLIKQGKTDEIFSHLSLTLSLSDLANYKGVSGTSVLVDYINALIAYGKSETSGSKRSKTYKEEETNKSFIRNNEQALRESALWLSSDLYLKHLEYIYAHAATQKAVFSFEDKNDYTASTIYNFIDKKINDGSEEYSFVTDWMKKFVIGGDFIINSLQGTAFSVRIFDSAIDKKHFLDGDKHIGVELADKGMGSNQLMILLWKMATFIRMYKKTPVKPTIIIEEPEQNLHPQVQSLLADLFLYLNEKYSFKFIIETHSEYMVRHIQVLAAKEMKSKESKNPFSVYYLTGDIKTPYYDMGFQKNGKFVKAFGKGFFNVSDDAVEELYDLEED